MIKFLYISIFLLVPFVSSIPLNVTTNQIIIDDTKDLGYRLTDVILPSIYNIKLFPYIRSDEGEKQFTFTGTVDITLKTIHDDIKEIVLHSKDLVISERKLVNSKNEENNIDDMSTSEKVEQITLKLSQPLIANETYILSFKFSGNLADNMQGFYKSYYLNKDKQQVWLASTQFQTTYARKAFPCFDEPKFKAKFLITISHHKSLTAISNMKMKEQTEVNSRFETTFHPTPIMSTYILAFLISDFKERKTNENFLVIARPDAYEQTKYSFEVGPLLLNSLNKYTNLEYKTLGNEKMHLAALPDFSAGAMENWGLLTYRERALLYDHDDTTAAAQQSIAGVIAHEQAHMWFGDYVTCEWWSYAWLNEGFARYFQYFTTHEINPDWEMDKQFVVDQIQTVFKMDATNTTNPMTDRTAETPEDLKKMFNSITYNKGGAILRMFLHSMGAEKFQAAIRKYLVKQKYSTSVPKDLFDSLEAEWKNKAINMAEYFIDWTEQVGYPVVTFKVSEDRKSAEISQNRFLLEQNGANETLRYTVPLTFATNKNNVFNKFDIKYLNKKDNITKIEFPDKIDWIIGNLQQIGYYRVNYDDKTWHAIHHALSNENWTGIHEINRAQIVDDLLNFGVSGLLQYDLILDILDFLKTETNYLPWTSAFNGFTTIETRLGKDNTDFGTYIKMIIEKVFKELGFEQNVNETRLNTYNRAKVLSWACKYGNEDCIKKAKDLFKSLRSDNKTIPVNIRAPVYCTALREGDHEDFNYLWAKYKNSIVSTEQVLILGVLGCTKNKTTIETYYNYTLASDIRLQDKGAALSSIQNGNAENPEILFDLINKNYTLLSKALGDDKEMASVVSSIAGKLTTKLQKEKLEKFLKDNGKMNPDAKKTIEKSIKQLEENLVWSTKTLEKFKTVLKKKVTKDSHNNSNKLSISTFITVLVCLLTYFNM